MEHLPHVTSPTFAPIEVRYLGHHSDYHWDGQSFSGFPERAEWDKEALIRGIPEGFISRKPSQFAAFVQQWMWFGMISTFLDRDFSTDELLDNFTKTSPTTGLLALTTERLPHLLEEWMVDINSQDTQNSAERLGVINNMLLEVRNHIACYMSAAKSPPNHPMRSHTDTSLSVIILAELLARVKLRVWPNSELFQFQRSDLLLERLAQHGWCPSDVTMLRTLMTSSGMYVPSLLRPRLASKDHRAAGCDRDFCKLMNVEGPAKRDYETAHVAGCNGKCGFHCLDPGELQRSLNIEKTFPATTYAKDEDGRLTLKVHDVSFVHPIKFVAISHVWVEGLGNVRENALPHCQLSRIQKLVDTVSGQESTPFWIDTLSVPQSDTNPDLEDLRKTAIISMNQVYQCSSAVLVLDAELLSTSVYAQIEEHLVRFICSSWLRRLWTLHEAVIGKRIMLQLEDRAIDMEADLFRSIANANQAASVSQVAIIEMADFVHRLIVFRMPDDRHLITKAWNACQFRSTSERQDEATCLAILLGLSAESLNAILEAPPEERWRIFLLEQRVFPKDLLFSLGPRVAQDGYRWAPQSFIRRPATQTATIPYASGVGRSSANGLTIPASGFVFGIPQNKRLPNEAVFYIHNEDSEITYTVRQTTVSKDGSASWESLRLKIQELNQLAIVLNHSLQALHERRVPSAMAVLVEVKSGLQSRNNTLSTINGRFLTTMSFAVNPPQAWSDLSQWLRQGGSSDEETKHICRVVSASAVSEEQNWCIG